MTSSPDLQKRVDAKRAERQRKLPGEWLLPEEKLQSPGSLANLALDCGLLNQKQREIISSQPSVILEALKQAKWTSLEVTKAFCMAATIGQQATNCLTEILFEEAYGRAEELDKKLKESGPVGPLHGLPVSIKDSCHVKGVDTTIGYVGWIGNIQKNNALIVDELLEAGAVIYCKTNIPSTLMVAESDNNVWGPALNPHNRKLTPGGSTGGESALLAMKGSVMGLGTDIAGSVRMPAAMAGICSLKPSVGRIVSGWGAATTVPGQESVAPTFGPMSVSMEGIDILMDALSYTKPWENDQKMIPFPWRRELVQEWETKPKLTIGILRHDGVVRPHPPIEEGIEKTVKALKEAGHEVIDWPTSYDYKPAQDLSVRAFTADGCVRYRAVMHAGHERPVGPILLGADRVMGETKCELTVDELWQLHKERNGLTNAHLALWQSTKNLTSTGKPIDVLLCPAAGHTAPLLGTYTYLGYTNVWNVFDLPATVFPIPGLKVEPQENWDKNKHLQSYTPVGEEDRENWEKYDPNVLANGPVCLQVVGLRFQEEKVVGATKAIENALKNAS